MELLYVFMLCTIGGVYSSKGVSYYYPPVYGSIKQVDYSTPKEAKDSKSTEYYYPPVYGKYEEKKRRPSHREESSYEVKKDDEYHNRRDQHKHRSRREHIRREEQSETDSHYRPRAAPKYLVKTRRTYSIKSVEKPTYYKTPQQKSYSKKSQKCFQCEYSPPKPINYEVLVTEPYEVKIPRTVQECEWERTIEYVYQAPKRGSAQMYGRYKEVPKYEKSCFPKVVFETKTKYRSKYVKKQKIGSSGGFEACKGPLDPYTAKKAGVDDWNCKNNCYVKKDKSGTITRGCYSGQYKVDPEKLGCHYQGDTKQDLYCFCKGDHCNGQDVPAPASSRPSYDY